MTVYDWFSCLRVAAVDFTDGIGKEAFRFHFRAKRIHLIWY